MQLHNECFLKKEEVAWLQVTFIAQNHFRRLWDKSWLFFIISNLVACTAITNSRNSKYQIMCPVKRQIPNTVSQSGVQGTPALMTPGIWFLRSYSEVLIQWGWRGPEVLPF